MSRESGFTVVPEGAERVKVFIITGTECCDEGLCLYRELYTRLFQSAGISPENIVICSTCFNWLDIMKSEWEGEDSPKIVLVEYGSSRGMFINFNDFCCLPEGRVATISFEEAVKVGSSFTSHEKMFVVAGKPFKIAGFVALIGSCIKFVVDGRGIADDELSSIEGNYGVDEVEPGSMLDLKRGRHLVVPSELPARVMTSSDFFKSTNRHLGDGLVSVELDEEQDSRVWREILYGYLTSSIFREYLQSAPHLFARDFLSTTNLVFWRMIFAEDPGLYADYEDLFFEIEELYNWATRGGEGDERWSRFCAAMRDLFFDPSCKGVFRGFLSTLEASFRDSA